MGLVSIIISIVSLIVSVISFIYNWYLNKRNIKISINKETYTFYKSKNDTVFTLLLNVNISNKSKNPISISSIHLTFNNEDIEAFWLPIGIIGDDPIIFGESYIYERKSKEIPCRLDSFESFENSIAFINGFDEYPQKEVSAKVKFCTSRGTINKHITIDFKEEQ